MGIKSILFRLKTPAPGGEAKGKKPYSSFRSFSFSASSFQTISHDELIEEETLPGYDPDNYYPAKIGETLNSQFRIISKLGYGTCSTVWLCRDLLFERYVAVKIHIRSSTGGTQARREIKCYEALRQSCSAHRGRGYVRQMLERFEISGATGHHLCLVHEPLSIGLTTLQHRLMPDAKVDMPILRAFCVFVLKAIDFLHKDLGYIYGDLRPANIHLNCMDPGLWEQMANQERNHPSERKIIDEERTLRRSQPVSLDQQWGEPVLCDFGDAQPIDALAREPIQTQDPSYRAPEVIMKMEWGTKVDIWSLGIMLWELLEGDTLFNANAMQNHGPDAQLLAQMVSILGPPPRRFLDECGTEALAYFNEDGSPKDMDVPATRLEDLLESLDGADKEAFLDFIRSTLTWLPDDRKSAGELLQHRWLRMDENLDFDI